MFKDLKCRLFGCIYPERKLPTEDYLLEMFPELKDEHCGVFIADTSKPCVRCGKMKNWKERK